MSGRIEGSHGLGEDVRVDSFAIQAARERWQALVADHRRRRQAALQAGSSEAELEDLDRQCNLLIDSAFSELQISESLARLNERL